MCLITPNKEKKIATEDIIVYKVLGVSLSSIIQDFRYKKDVLHETEIKEGSYWMAADHIAIEALKDSGYNPFRDHENDHHIEERKKLLCIGEGFHSCKTLERANLIKNEENKKSDIYEFIIPKGAEYYEDLSDLLVSNKIIMKDELPYNKG